MKKTHTPWYKTTIVLAILPTLLFVLGLVAAFGNGGLAFPAMYLPFLALYIGFGLHQMRREHPGQPGETLIIGGVITFICSIISSVVVVAAGGSPVAYALGLWAVSGFMVLIGYLQRIAAKK